jgi:hypothetical protein
MVLSRICSHNDHALELVTRNKPDKLRQEITQLGNIIKAGRDNTSTGREAT